MALQVRRVVTGHDANGKAIVASDERMKGVSAPARPYISRCEIWSNDTMPVDNSEAAAAAQKKGFVVRHNYVGSGQGTVVRITEFAPSAPKFMHRTETVDYAMLLSAAGEPAHAGDIGALYQAYAIVTGTDMRQRPWGFAQCLREVLVKVSGEPRLKDDPRVVELAAHADRLVASFDYVDMMAGIPKKDDQGSYDRPHKLTVHFDPVKIDSMLAELGQQPWHGERPVVVPMLLVQGRKPPAYVLSAEVPAGEEQRGSFANAAGEFGMNVRMPREAELAAWGVAVAGFPFPKAAPPSEGL